MMQSLLPLLRIQRLIAWRSFRDRLGGGRSKWGLLLIPLAGLAFVPIIGGISGMYLLLYGAAKLTGQGQLLLTMALTAGQLVGLMFGIFYVISAFYFSKDLPVLVPLPIRAGEIVLVKFIGILAGEYLTVLPVVLPALVIYGVLADVSWTYVPFALVILLLLPVIPLVISSLFSMLLMRVTNMRRNRDLWRVLGALVGVGMAIGINYVSRFGSQSGKFSTDTATRQMQDLLSQKQPLLEAAARWFPTTGWATNALREGAPALGAGSFLLFVAVAVAALFLLLWAAEKIFYSGLLGGDDSGPSGKALTREELARETGQVRSPLRALLQREMRLLNRTPSFLMAAVLPVLLLPVMAFLGLLQAGDLRSLPARPWSRPSELPWCSS
jgi:ABC-2 type transport system permease protein